MAGLDLIIMRSKADPSLYVVTERSRYRSAMDAFHSSNPEDSLIHVPPNRAELLLRGLSDQPSVQSAIDADGLYRHQIG